MNIYDIVILAILFIILTPGILLRLPVKGSSRFVAVVHGIVFGVIVFLLHIVSRKLHRHILEGADGDDVGPDAAGPDAAGPDAAAPDAAAPDAAAPDAAGPDAAGPDAGDPVAANSDNVQDQSAGPVPADSNNTITSPSKKCKRGLHWNGSRCISCNRNTPFWSGNTCIGCPANTYWNGTTCLNCQDKTTSNKNSTICRSCNARKKEYWNESTKTCTRCKGSNKIWYDNKCIKCGKNDVYDTNKKQCVTCTANKHSTGIKGSCVECNKNQKWSTKKHKCVKK
jgi:hypothetical protein